jgi:hypothetical protein
MRAIELWHRKFPGTFPTTFDALLSTDNTRFLRKKWKDPITNAFDWRIIKMRPDGSIQGLNLTPSASPLGPSSFDLQSQGKSNATGTGSPSAYGSPTPGSGVGIQGTGQGLSGSPTSGNVGGFSSQPQGGSSQSAFTPVLGGIVGVASSSEKESIKSYNGRTKYNEWEFVYLFSGPTMGAGVPQGQVPSGQKGPLQGGGGGPSPGAVNPTPRPQQQAPSPLQ